jgi:predicted ATPase
MPTTFQQLAFTPSVNDIIASQQDKRISVLTGGNNSGKSAYLKKTVYDQTMLYIGVNRFYSFHNLNLYKKNDAEIHQWFNSTHQTINNTEFNNYEGSFFSAQNALTRLSNERRDVLFKAFTDMFGLPIRVGLEEPNNEFSSRYISVDGDSLSVTSSGTRLFLGILAALMDERFRTIAIDEPELGLSPMLQRKLANIIVGGDQRETLFPHNPSIVISTHSHLFLDKDVPGNNWIVSKRSNLIEARRCQGFSELHDIQFRLLGNDLSTLFLPDAIIFVEGETDKMYIDKILSLHMPSSKIVVESCASNIAARVGFWASSLGDMQTSPYRNRTFVVYDSEKQSGLERALDNAKIPRQQRIEWQGNGIEYVYPPLTIAAIYRRPEMEIKDLVITSDEVVYGEFSYKKMALARQVVDSMSIETTLPSEIQVKLLAPLRLLLCA